MVLVKVAGVCLVKWIYVNWVALELQYSYDTMNRLHVCTEFTIFCLI